MKILNKLKITFLSKAYTEGIYSDTPANRKLGRVGMSYIDYSKKVKSDKEEKAEKKYYYAKLDDGEEIMLEESATSKEKALELAINFAEDRVKYNDDIKEFHFNLEENIDNWSDEDLENEDKVGEWYGITAEKNGKNIDISVFDYNNCKSIRNDKLERELKAIKNQSKKSQEKANKEFKEKYGWMKEVLDYKKNQK